MSRLQKAIERALGKHLLPIHHPPEAHGLLERVLAEIGDANGQDMIDGDVLSPELLQELEDLWGEYDEENDDEEDDTA